MNEPRKPSALTAIVGRCHPALLAAVLGLFVGARAMAALEPVEYVSPEYLTASDPTSGIASWVTNSVTEYVVVTSAANAVTWGEADATKWYVVSDSEVRIDGGVSCLGDVRLILCEGARLLVTNAASGVAGIATDADGAFTVYGQPDGAGALAAFAGDTAAGIGGGSSADGQNIVLNGGTVVATGGGMGAGIGGGMGAVGQNIVVNGGTVTARGGASGAGIGGGMWRYGRDITVNGGRVTAIGISTGAGIGGGGGPYGGSSGRNIRINGGFVRVTSTSPLRSFGDLIGGGYGASAVVSQTGVSDDASVLFNLAGEDVTLPDEFEGFFVLTPSEPVDRVLVSGAASWTASTTFAVSNAATAASTNLLVNGSKVRFGSCVIALTDADGVLSLTATNTSTILAPPDVARASWKIHTWTNGVEAILETGIEVPLDRPAFIVFEANDGCLFPDGRTVITNTIDTSVDPAAYDVPEDALPTVEYDSPVYVTAGDPASGIARWETNAISATGYTVVTDSPQAVEWGSSFGTTWYVVLDDVTIRGGVTCRGRVNLILCEDARLTITDVPDDAAGIAQSQSSLAGAFAVYGQTKVSAGHEGVLTVTGGKCGAGIGGGSEKFGAYITVNGGVVTATGGQYGAGIGGGLAAEGGDITVNGGRVTAVGVDGAAGIGGSMSGSGSDITVNGGTVTAIGGDCAAAIGGGDNARGTGIAINGGRVRVANDGYGDLIGSGYWCGSAASENSVSAAAEVLFSPAGPDRAMPDDFTGFAVMTPETPPSCVLADGVASWTASTTFLLTNAVTAAATNAVVNGGKNRFANRMVGLTHSGGTLALAATGTSTIYASPTVGHATWKIYVNGIETAVSPSVTVPLDTPAYIVYTADAGYVFPYREKAVTNRIDTSVDPATYDVPDAATYPPVEYAEPVYVVDGDAESGIDHWVTNHVTGYSYVSGASGAVTWGAAGVTNWYVVTNGTFAIGGGVTCQGHVRLILCADASLTIDVGSSGLPGIGTDANGSFSVYGQAGVAEGHDGVLVSRGFAGSAGIGGRNELGGSVVSHITINGGIVTALCTQWYGAGIGGGICGAGSYIAINGGTVTATGGRMGAGIGGGFEGAGSHIAINGGLVTATGCGGAAIGGGGGGGGSHIAINGGVIRATAAAADAGSVGSFIGNGDICSTKASGNAISAAASVLFNLAGTDQALPAVFDGLVLLTPRTIESDRRIADGFTTWPASQTFTLTNATEHATGAIAVNGGAAFAHALLSLPHEDGTLTLQAVAASTIYAAPEIPHVVARFYTNEVYAAMRTSVTVPLDTPSHVIFEVDRPDWGYVFSDGSTAVTNTIDTSVDPATYAVPDAPTTRHALYVYPEYVDDGDVTSGIARWCTNSVSAYAVVSDSAGAVTWGTAGVTNWYVVTNGTFAIGGGVTCQGHVRLILRADARLTVTGSDESAGIAADADGSFEIFGTPDGAGALTATGGNAGAGIGGDSGCAGSRITINGGTVTAEGGECGAGIGGGAFGTGSDLAVNGGTVTAIAGDYAAGIGGGCPNVIEVGDETKFVTMAGTRITINGGSVTAIGSEGAAAIGGAAFSPATNVVIRGGTVRVANGNFEFMEDGALIGGGNFCSEDSVGNRVTGDARVLFCIADAGTEMPAEFGEFAIMTPESQLAGRVLANGLGEWTASAAFALTNAVNGATGSIEVGGEGTAFAHAMLTLSFGDGALQLLSESISTIYAPTNLAHACWRVWTNGVEAVFGESVTVPRGTPARIAFEVEGGEEGPWRFPGGVPAVTNTINTSVDPATYAVPVVSRIVVEYEYPVYSDAEDATSGIDGWFSDSTEDYEAVTSSTAAVTWGNAGATNWYAVIGRSVRIDGGVTCRGHVRLVLCEGARLLVTNTIWSYLPGIATDADGSFAVYGQPSGAGTLLAYGDYLAAGIGGGQNCAGSHITINGGTVTAESMQGGAGIGGGLRAGGTDITINGGTVRATGGMWGAGIGGGRCGTTRAERGVGSDITVNGGTVTATGGEHAAGVGGGANTLVQGYATGDGTNITVNGGTLTAIGGASGGAGIGGGTAGSGSCVAIRGGTVTARAGSGACAAIGGGSYGRGLSIVIEGGTVRVANDGTSDLIGNGRYTSTVSSGNAVLAEAKVLFNLVGTRQAMPEDFDGCVLLTPATLSGERVLVRGVSEWSSEALTFALTNAATAAAKSIVVNGNTVAFAGTACRLTLADGILKLAAGVTVEHPVVDDIDGNPVTIEVPLTWRENWGVSDDALLSVNRKLANGMPAWQSFVLGIDPTNDSAGIYADAPQYDNAEMVALEIRNIDPESVADGFGLRGLLVKDGVETNIFSGLTAAIDVASSDPTGRYRLGVILASNDVWLAQTAETVNEVGIVCQTQAVANAIVSVPWGALKPGDPAEIAVSNVVMTASLAEGDELRVYRPGLSTYEAWRLSADKTWEPVQVYVVGFGDPIVVPAVNAEAATIPRGSGIWLCRQSNLDAPYILCGQCDGEDSDVLLEEGPNLIGATGTTNWWFSAHVTGATEDDTIQVPGADGSPPRIFSYRNGEWGYRKSVAVEENGVTVGTRKVWTTTESYVAPGRGFWLLNAGGDAAVQ